MLRNCCQLNITFLHTFKEAKKKIDKSSLQNAIYLTAY